MLRYTLMRLGIFVGCLVVVWGLVSVGFVPRGLGDSNGFWIVLLALILSAPISFVVLRKERDRASAQIAAKVARAKANLEANRSQEDVADDAARATADGTDATGTTPAAGDAEGTDGERSATTAGQGEKPAGREPGAADEDSGAVTAEAAARKPAS